MGGMGVSAAAKNVEVMPGTAAAGQAMELDSEGSRGGRVEVQRGDRGLEREAGGRTCDGSEPGRSQGRV